MLNAKSTTISTRKVHQCVGSNKELSGRKFRLEREGKNGRVPKQVLNSEERVRNTKHSRPFECPPAAVPPRVRHVFSFQFLRSCRICVCVKKKLITPPVVEKDSQHQNIKLLTLLIEKKIRLAVKYSENSCFVFPTLLWLKENRKNRIYKNK